MRAISLNFYVIICCAVLTSFTAAAQTVEAQNYSSLVYPGID